MSVELKTVDVDCEALAQSFPSRVGSCFSLDFLAPIFAKDSVEKFFPKSQQSSIYVRQEMADVFCELTKTNRKPTQVLIGSPGIGKSLLLFIVALYRARNEQNAVVVYLRKTRRPRELTSVFVISAKTADQLQVSYSRTLLKTLTVEAVLQSVLQQCASINPSETYVKILDDEVLLFLDGLHSGDEALESPYHYLTTSGGFDSMVGE